MSIPPAYPREVLIMFKSLNSLWLRNARQLGKVQRRQSAKLVKAILKPVPAKKVVLKKTTLTRVSVASTSRGKSVDAGVWSRSTFIAGVADQAAGIPLGKRMEYWLYRPSSMTAGITPLVVMLHGCEQTATDFAHGTRMNRLAESKGFGVLYPQQSASAQSHRCWPWFRREVQAGDGEVRLIAAIMRRVVDRHHFDPSRVYLAGISAGAAMAQIVALRHPQLVAAVGLHSAPVYGAASSSVSGFAVMQRGGSRQVTSAISKVTNANATFPVMPAILIQGQQDSVVRPVNLHQLEQQFCQLNGLTATQRQPHRYHAAGRTAQSAHAYDSVDYRRGKKTLLRICEIFQLEHAWSGGDPAYRFNTRKGPDASRMMWQFFKGHSREGRIT